ncbi:MAG TPA: amino acid adenylation domain-containing protein [Polyangiaceae bacterium]|nr:amino acid adenylation domain-containing protein [Polyangiaceae bacterium]
MSPEKRQLLERLLAEQTHTSASPRATGRLRAPLSFEQERLWFLNQLDPADTSYNLHLQLPLPSNLARDVWRRCWQLIVLRHAALRTHFEAEDGHPIQVIDTNVAVEIPELDLTGLTHDAQRARALELATEQAETPFELSRAPLLRLALLRFQDRYVQLITLHHCIADGWSVDVLLRELDHTYSALTRGTAPALEPLPLSYADFAAWQRETLTGERLAGLLQFWRATLEGAPTLELPFRRERPTKFSGRADVLQQPIAPALVLELRALAKRENATLFMLLLASFVTTLHRYSGQTDVVVGTPLANRAHAGVEGMVGLLLNSVLMRVQFEPHESFSQLLQRVRQTTLDAYDHSELPFARLVEELQPARDLAKNPLYQVMFQLLQSRNRTARADALMAEIGYDRASTNLDLSVDVFEGSDELLVKLEYSQTLFDAAAVESFLGHWQRVLAAACAQPHAALSTLRLASEDERRQAFDARGRSVAPPGTITQLLRAAVERHARHVALVCDERCFTYQELGQRTARLASRLVQRGVGPEVKVAVSLADPVELLLALWSVWRAGGAYVYVDPEWPEARRREVVAQVEPSFWISDGEQPLLDTSAPDEGEVGLDASQPGHAAVVLFTSGSSGRPKGIVLEHGALANQASWMQEAWPLTSSDCVLQKYSFAFDAALAEVLIALTSGARLVVDRARGRDVDRLVELMSRHAVTHLDLTPSLLTLLLNHPDIGRCRTLRRVVCGGERLTARLVARARERFPRAELINAYGPAEACITATAHTCTTPSGSGEGDPPIGTAISGIAAYVLDPSGEPVPPGMQGELCLGGIGLARGYVRPATAQTGRGFFTLVAAPEHRLYATGDRVRQLAGGELQFLGRLDGQLKLRGLRVEPAEVESILCSHPDVQAALVAVSRVPALTDAEAASLLHRVERLTEFEADFLARFETNHAGLRSRTMWRRTDNYELYLHLPDDQFVRTPRASQRNWLLQRALDELGADLDALDRIAEHCVAGSERPLIEADLAAAPIEYRSNELLIGGQQVMQAWEQPLMQAMAAIAAESRGDVLEVGFGLGLSATALQSQGVRSHTIVEANPEVRKALERWRAESAGSRVSVLAGRWQEVELPAGAFDAVLFDAYPTSEEEYERDVLESPTYAAAFFDTALRVLRPGGVFVYYSNEIDSLSRRHQRLLLERFRSFSVSLVENLQPPADCQYWWASSMAVVKAVA